MLSIVPAAARVMQELTTDMTASGSMVIDFNVDVLKLRNFMNCDGMENGARCIGDTGGWKS